MSEKKYNGWTNYETWAVKLWIDNEEPSYRYWREAAQEAYAQVGSGLSAYARMTGTEIFTREERARHNLADRLKEEHEEGVEPEAHASVYTDLLNAALSEVDRYEIAESLLSEVDSTEEGDDGENDEEAP